MGRFLHEARFSQLWLTFGVLVGAPMVLVMSVIDGLPLAVALLVAVVMAAFLGGILALSLMDWRQRLRAAVGPLPEGREQATLRAANRGPVPADPEVRRTALRVAQHNLRERRRHPWLRVAVLAVVTGQAIVQVLTGSDWWWLGVALGIALLVGHLFEPRRLERRVQLLGAESGPTPQNA